MEYINIGKTACDNCLLKPPRYFTIFDIWKLFGGDWDIKKQKELNLKLLEKKAIENALEISNNVQVDATKLLGIAPRTILYKMRKHKIKTKRQKEEVFIIDNSLENIEDWKEMELCEI